MDLTVQNVYGLLLRSKLLPLDDARAMYQRWQTEAKDQAHNLPQFLKWVVAHKYLTDYQAGLLSRGHADGFYLNQYKILDRLGKGRMAAVYRAAHELGQVVAIKVLPPSRSRDPQFLGRFRREARMATRLKHPNIVRAFQVGQIGELHYLVMEYLEGETFDEVLQRRGKLLPGEAVRLIHQALLGLQHVHEKGLVHRDLKPSNLMLVPPPGPDGSTLRCTVKLLDIGLGRALEPEPGPAQADGPGLTTEGLLLGTPDYMAPEQARDARTADIRADIYSLGCVLYHALAGQPPFPDTNVLSQMIRHATEAARPLKELNPAVPDGLQQIVNWMLAKDPSQRYPTPERAAQALQVFLASGSEPVAMSEADPKTRSYLTWVEAENSKQEIVLPAASAPPKPPSSPAVPVAVPLKPGAAAPKVHAREHSKKSAGGKRRKKHKHHAAAPVAVPVKPGETSPAFDVELVPLAAAATAPPAPAAKAGWSLTRRDLVLFGVGVVGTLIAILIALLLATLFPKRAGTPTPLAPASATE